MKACETQDLCRNFLRAVERMVQALYTTNLTQPTDAEGYCEMAQNCGPIGWDVIHGVAAAFREHVCEECGRDAESLMRAAHDLVNTKLGKPLHSPTDLTKWEKIMRQAIPDQVLHAAKGNPAPEFERWADVHTVMRSGVFKNSPAVLQGGPPSFVAATRGHHKLPACKDAQRLKLEHCIRSVKAKRGDVNPWAVCQARLKCSKPAQMKAQDHEVGYALCETPDGRTVHGPEAHGDHDHVNIPLVCPAGSRPYGTFHTHPDGEPNPSTADHREGCRLGLKLLCVSDGQRNDAHVSCVHPRC